MSNSGTYLHRAAYVVPVAVDQPEVIMDGAVHTRNGLIVEVGSYDALKDRDALEVDYPNGVLVPALVNCHCHLELSHLARLGKVRSHEPGNMTDWIRNLLTEREKGTDPAEDPEMAAWQALARLYAGGCRGLLDIGNLPGSRDLAKNFKVNSRFFQEILGLTEGGVAAGLSLLSEHENDQKLFYTAHAPYSTAPELLVKLKERARRHGHLFPIHVAESLDETEFLATGRGRFRDFLAERNTLGNSFKAPGLSPIAYLASLGLLDEQTLCVHCVQCDEADLAIMSEHRVTACICPGSNRFIGVGTAPVPQMLAHGIPVVLGTDSLTSNPHLSLWQEMKILAQNHPGLRPLEIIRMATGNGAELLGLAAEIGSLAPGCSAEFLAVSGDLPAGSVADEILPWLVATGLAIKTEWVE